MTATLEPAASSTNASSRTNASDYNPIALLGCLVGLNPLYTGSQGEHCRVIISGDSIVTKR